MADENEADDELTEIVVTAPDGGGGSGGGGGGWSGLDLWGGWDAWQDAFIWTGGTTGPDEGGGSNGDVEASPEIVVTAPATTPAPINDLAAIYDALINSLNYEGVGDWEGMYRLFVLADENGEGPQIRLDILDPETLAVETYIVSETSSFNYSTPIDQNYDYPQEWFQHSGPEDAPDQWNWA